MKTLIVASPEVSHAYRMCRPNSKNSKLESVCFEGLSSSNNNKRKSFVVPFQKNIFIFTTNILSQSIMFKDFIIIKSR